VYLRFNIPETKTGVKKLNELSKDKDLALLGCENN
jgi:hypothetical protein